MPGALDDILNAVKASKAAKEETNTMDMLTKSMSAAHNIGGAFGKVLGTIASVAKVAMTGLGALGAILGSVTGALTAPIDAIKEMADAIIQLVGLANPGAVQQFTLALNDAMAVIGSAMTPVLEGMTIAMRAVGDTLASLMPIFQPVFNQLGQSIANWAMGMKGLYEAAATLIDLMMMGLVDVLKDVSVGVAYFQGALTELIKILTDAFTAFHGISSFKSKFDPNASSQGAALRQYKVSSVDQFSKDLFAKQLAVLGKGGQGKTPEQNMEEIRKAMEDARTAVKNIAVNAEAIYNWLTKDLPTLVRSLIPDLPSLGDAADAVGGGVSGLAGTLIKALLK